MRSLVQTSINQDMKYRLFLLLLVPLFLNGCRKDTPNVSLVTIHIVPEYFRTTIDYTSKGYAIISDDEGNVLSTSLLSNNTTVNIEGDFDLQNKQYHLTFVTYDKWIPFDDSDPGFHYTLKTYLDISGQDVQIAFNPNSSQLADVHIENIPDFQIITFNGSFAGSGYDYSMDDASIHLEVPVSNAPEDIFIYWQKQGSPDRKFIFYEEMTGLHNVTFNYDDIPVMEDSVIVTAPQNTTVYQTVYGSKGTDNQYVEIAKNGTIDDNKITLHFPNQIFDTYFVLTSAVNENGRYFSERSMDEVATEYQLADLDFEVTDTSIDKYQMECDVEYDFFTYYTLHDTQQGYLLTWDITGASAPQINFDLSNIIENLPGDHPVSNVNLVPSSTQIIDFKSSVSYEQFINDHYARGYNLNDKKSSNPYERFAKPH